VFAHLLVVGNTMGTFTSTSLAAAAALCCAGALAQTTQTVTITGSSAANSAGVAGFGDMPLSRSPLSATVIGTSQLLDAGITSLADITRLDAGITDAYNAPGYWGQVAVRGFTLDNRFNFRRDGLPVNAETVLPVGNKAALELLKGASGIQAGTSAPGGLLNLVVKRPAAQPVAAAAIEWVEPGTLGVDADIGNRHGAFGWRVNAGATRLDPATRNSRGSSHLVAAAGEWQLREGLGLLEAEVENSRQRQPSTPGFSLLGNRLPDPEGIDPTLNLNNQAWSLPVVFQGHTGSLRYTHTLAEQLQARVHLMRQRLLTEDRIAFPFGCSAENNFDRYCSDGSFDFYDYRSEGERRITSAADLSLQGRHTLAGAEHRWSAGLLGTRHEGRFNRQAFNYAGTGWTDGSAVVEPDPTLTDENTNRRERSTEARVQDAIMLSSQWQLWAGARHTRIERSAVRTDGSRPTAYTQRFTTPWLALAWQATPALMAYASWGQGVESEVAPNRARYTNAGQALPALKSEQIELGLKWRAATLQGALALFDTRRPQWADFQRSTGLPGAGCSDADPCTRRADGASRHRGIEAEAEWRSGPVSLRGSTLLLKARREGSADPAVNGLRPTNVPARSLKLQAAYNVLALPGLALLAFASHEGDRMVLPDNSVATAGWTRIDLGARYAQGGAGSRWVWRAGVDNVADQRAWKESPYQFGHAYLYPLAPRTWRLALNITL
jgi:iron complex outermembrane recepter protein